MVVKDEIITTKNPISDISFKKKLEIINKYV